LADANFTVAGRRVVVVGAARSGVAAAELLVRRGARVMLTDMRPSFEQAAALGELGVELELGRTIPARSARPISSSSAPGCR
jgi:UDP-N-acetylmuramoylalanine-D-glutamate ligase